MRRALSVGLLAAGLPVLAVSATAQATPGTVSFRPPLELPSGVPSSVAIADVDADGKLDIVTANADGGDSVTVLLEATGVTPALPAGYRSRDDYPTGANPNDVIVADVDGDHDLDIVTANILGGTVSTLLGDGHDADRHRPGPRAHVPVPRAGDERHRHQRLLEGHEPRRPLSPSVSPPAPIC